MTVLDDFRADTRAWLDENCPPSMRAPMVNEEVVEGGSKVRSPNPDSYVWLDRMVERGWTVPAWPKAYGGAELDKNEYVVLLEEMARINARAPLAGHGVVMIGPTLLEYGNEEQKSRHLPKIAQGEIRWCQGYSEPGSGSDLASLSTKAEDQGDHFLLNGQKIWTSGAEPADWIFCLVRTDPDAPKHEGISFVLFPMDSAGVSIKPIRLISGSSPFCETFLDNVVVPKDDLIHKMNQGWTVAKRLLQHERSGLPALAGAASARLSGEQKVASLPQVAMDYIGVEDDRLADPILRDEIAQHRMNGRSFSLTQQRVVEESEAGKTLEATTSIFKFYGADLGKMQQDLLVKARGTQSFGWEGDGFSAEELALGRLWLSSRGSSIAGGTNEVQLNIIAKRVLGLPD
ncbi:MAG: acyl-CoA dehydrogenase family protein [Pseudomonadales bacterium]|nr:acyl-CoA dehydrogenase family protein [Pseudomonadales bacterium]HJN51692.1 acyl-CoA dehydrogenase family protein [Pseudomonadales bacterium]